ncbi:unnamed protein product [Penicillium camemberti]|uniref:Str. FM013 n=1 Tax=Penicillium camemberti (strain FM 013) TaxID=1429867 RepID=A0A0G4PFW3_PENC3|nr:unnamed protein product [Penicillium camemberti]
MSGNPGDGKPPRRPRKPQGFFSEKRQEQRNEAVRGQLEGELPIRSKEKRGAPDDSQAESGSVKKKQKKEEPKPKPLDVKAFLADLKTDYSKKKLEPMPPRPPKQKWRPVKTPITDRTKAPKGWNPREPDLINDDLESQITRCRERIKENIMPHVYEYKLEEFLFEQKERNKKVAAEHGLNWPVVQRLENLKSILEWAQSTAIKDKYNMASNIQNVILAYQSGVLNWCHGFVTYWHNGAQLCAPRPFKWNEFQYLYDAPNGNETGFWVEGIDGPGPSSQQAVIECGTGTRKWAAETPITLRIPMTGGKTQPGPFEFQFKDDTGADYMVLHDEDVNRLRTNLQANGVSYPLPRTLGVLVVTLGDGSKKAMLVRELEVNMWDEKEKKYMAASWDSIPVVVLPGRGTKRLNGPWMRWKFYTGTAPDNSNRLWIYDYNPTNPLMRGPRLPTATQAQMDRPLPTANKYESIGNHPQFNPDIPSGKSII